MPSFLYVKVGDFVVIEEDLFSPLIAKSDWWIGQVLYIVSGARSSSVNSIFQVANIDTGHIKSINADLVTAIVKSNKWDELIKD